MEPNYSKIFNKEILSSVNSFCKLNNIEDKDDFIYLCFKQGFDIKKFGLLGETLNDGEKDLKTGGIQEKRVEIEVIREIRVEVPVEVIKEVEKVVEVIKEVPVEKIIEKIVEVSDDTQINELLLKIQQLENKQPEIVEVIKEVTVEKSNDKTLMLQETLVKLRLEIVDKTKKIEELENKIKTMESNMSQPAFYLKGSNLNQKM